MKVTVNDSVWLSHPIPAGLLAYDPKAVAFVGKYFRKRWRVS